jgi:carbamoyltransferase
VEHHRSHAAAAFLASPFDHAAILTIDGLGEWATASIGQGANHRLRVLEEQRFPHSIGLIYSLVTAYCGFRPNCDEYKVMGFAPYGVPRFADQLERSVVQVGDDGSVRVDARAVSWYGERALGGRALRAAFDGPPRRAGDPLTDRERDLAASVQALTERAVLAMARRAHELTGERALCLAGGVALNCVANGVVARQGPFEDLWMQPAAGDAAAQSGQRSPTGTRSSVTCAVRLRCQPAPIGCAARCSVRRSLTTDVLAELERLGVGYRLVAGIGQTATTRWRPRSPRASWSPTSRGPMEFGPRALGNRSLLADPRRVALRDRLNAEVKGRESFRPFAPAVLAEHATAWFELPVASPYMGVVAPVLAHDEAGGPARSRRAPTSMARPGCRP